MNESPNNTTPDDWRDHLVDRALKERLGGDAPPDRSAAILAAAEAEINSSQGDLKMATTNNTQSFRGWALAASLLVNCALVAVLASSGGKKPDVAIADNPNASQPSPTAASEDHKSNAKGVSSVPGKALDTFPGEEAGGDLAESMDDTSAPAVEQPDFDSLIDTIQSTVESDARQEEGQKPAETKPFSDNLGLRVSQSQEVHEQSGPDKQERTSRKKLAPRMGGSSATPQPPAAERPVDSAAAQPVISNTLSRERERAIRREAGRYEHYAKPGLTSEDRLYTPLYANLAGQEGQRSREHRWRGQLGTVASGLDPYGPLPGQEWQGSPDGEGLGPGAAGDQYERIHENPFMAAIGGDAISTFSIDVDTASYANVRQMLVNGQQPPADAVRIEELVNYFDYDYEPPSGGTESSVAPTPSPSPGGGGQAVPFAAHVETAACPWRSEHRLVRIGIKGREIPEEQRPVSNLVFLIDVSGSMNNPVKLPLVKHGLMKLAKKLGENDRVAIVVYASSEGLALPSTPGTEQETILAALDNLNAGGSTAGGAGIRLAYQIAEDNFIEGGTNRVILCTDGDFNVGTTNTAELERLVEKKAKDTKVFLSCIGFGRGNLNDQMMEKITGIGNGNYYYADSQQEAERIFVKGMTGMLVTIAKDVKIQVEFNPAKVAGYRLLGYENRILKTQDFNDDKKDAGEIGAGHTVTCLYEIVPAGKPMDTPDVDELKYQRPAGLTDAADTGEMLTLKMRYKQPDEDVSTKLEWPISDSGHAFGQASTDLQFAASVASFGMLLRDSKYKGDTNYDAVVEIAESSLGDDPNGDRSQFVDLVRAAKQIMPEPTIEEAEAEASADEATETPEASDEESTADKAATDEADSSNSTEASAAGQ